MVRSEAVELTSGGAAGVLAEQNALAKVRGAQLPEGGRSGAYVLGTDTLVCVGRRVMGKPESAQEATEMLGTLSDRKHQVVSGVALARLCEDSSGERGDNVLVKSVSTDVVFAKLGSEQIAAYIQSDEWRGKAGGYAVQGMAAVFVHSIKGEYSNVVGLPLHLLYKMFCEMGFDILRRRWIETDSE